MPEPLYQILDPERFLAAILTERQKTRASFHYAEIARRAGFASRSYVRLVLTGRRPLTPASLPRFSSAFGLKGDERRFLDLICTRKHGFPLARLTPAQLEARITEVQRRRQSTTRGGTVLKAQQIYRHEAWPAIYAALGTPAEGATLAQICQRTGFSSVRVGRCLPEMLRAGIVSQREDRFFGEEFHSYFRDLGADRAFREFFVDRLKEAHAASGAHFGAPDHLFFSSVVCVDARRLPEFKGKLRDLLEEYSGEIENHAGDRVVRMVASLY